MLEFHGVYTCPVCGWLVSPTEYAVIRFDPDCKGCGVRKWSEYVPCRLERSE